MKFNGIGWVYVGSPEFSSGAAWFTSIAINSTGTPYVIYQDNGLAYKATVMKYNGTSWTAVGSAAFSAGVASTTSIAIDASGAVYAGYSDYSLGHKAVVMKFASATGISNTVLSSGNGISTFPNPATGILSVLTPMPIGSLSLQDISGKQLATKQVSNILTSFDIQSIPRGIYFAVWNDGTGQKSVQKVVVE
jgi:hypothetical protein